MRACPYCAERIQDAAIICRFCGRDVTPVSAARPGSYGPSIAPLIRVVALTVLVVLLSVALLYAYRAQSPSAQPVTYSRAVAELQSGQVKQVTIAGDTATLDKIDGSRETVTTNDGGAFQKTVLDYNATQPANARVQLQLQKDSQTFDIVGSIVLSLLPLLLIGALVVYVTRLVVQALGRR